MIRAWARLPSFSPLTTRLGHQRHFSATSSVRVVKSIASLPARAVPQFAETSHHSLLALQWPSPPRNILFVRKDSKDSAISEATLELARHLHSTYPDVNLVFEPRVAASIHDELDFPVFSLADKQVGNAFYQEKIDLTATLGGDGTILHAASLFSTASSVPPILSFSMGTLGFLGEWKFAEYKRAFREVYVSGAPSSSPDSSDQAESAWTALRGKSMGSSRPSRILLRNRLRIGLFDANGVRLPHAPTSTSGGGAGGDVFALNEVLLHRGSLPHLAHITILIGSPGNQRTLTTAIADGMLICTPTGSTAYSLSSGGSIVHPLVSSLLLTPICPRSLSFRPLVLPANTPVTLRIDELNRGKEIEVSVDGVRRREGLKVGMEVRVVGEETRSAGAPGERQWKGGVPSIVRSSSSGTGTGGGQEDHWVGGLNSLLKFNYPFGEDG